MQKAHIMQMLIRGDIYEASEMYEAVMRASEREGAAFQSSVRLWAHELRVYLRDVERECVVALFPGVIPVRHDSRTGFFCADESFKWPPTATDMRHSMRQGCPTPHPPVRDRPPLPPPNRWDRPPLPPPNRRRYHRLPLPPPNRWDRPPLQVLRCLPRTGGRWHWLRICGVVVYLVFVFFLPLPKEVDQPRMYAKSPASPSGSGGARVRILHLCLADSDRRARFKARFVLDENAGWEIFLAGCRERLQVENIRRVADSSGKVILAVEDVVHDDHLVIYGLRHRVGSG